MNSDSFLNALEELGLIASERKLVIDIAICDGIYSILASKIDEVCADNQSVFLSDTSTIQDIANEVGEKLSLPKDWLCHFAHSLANSSPIDESSHGPFGDYPQDVSRTVGLRLFITSPEYIAMMQGVASTNSVCGAPKHP